MMIAEDFNDAFKIQDRRENDDASAWIQWKGTDVCMDVMCKCGNQGHVDDYFAYTVKCTKCGTEYFCNGHIQLIEIKNPAGNSKEF